jgi:hypothetical protein
MSGGFNFEVDYRAQRRHRRARRRRRMSAWHRLPLAVRNAVHIEKIFGMMPERPSGTFFYLRQYGTGMYKYTGPTDPPTKASNQFKWWQVTKNGSHAHPYIAEETGWSGTSSRAVYPSINHSLKYLKFQFPWSTTDSTSYPSTFDDLSTTTTNGTLAQGMLSGYPQVGKNVAVPDAGNVISLSTLHLKGVTVEGEFALGDAYTLATAMTSYMSPPMLGGSSSEGSTLRHRVPVVIRMMVVQESKPIPVVEDGGPTIIPWRDLSPADVFQNPLETDDTNSDNVSSSFWTMNAFTPGLMPKGSDTPGYTRIVDYVNRVYDVTGVVGPGDGTYGYGFVNARGTNFRVIKDQRVELTSQALAGRQDTRIPVRLHCGGFEKFRYEVTDATGNKQICMNPVYVWFLVSTDRGIMSGAAAGAGTPVLYSKLNVAWHWEGDVNVE